VLKPLDIFIKMENGTYEWRAAAEDFELAISKIEELATIAPADYVILAPYLTSRRVRRNHGGIHKIANTPAQVDSDPGRKALPH
jgi:hypothetical protein